MHLPKGERACPQLLSPQSYMKAGILNIDKVISVALLRELVKKNFRCEEQSVPCVSSFCLQWWALGGLSRSDTLYFYRESIYSRLLFFRRQL